MNERSQKRTMNERKIERLKERKKERKKERSREVTDNNVHEHPYGTLNDNNWLVSGSHETRQDPC